MLHTIEIFQESGERTRNKYRAIAGQRQAAGRTAGQALDSLGKLLAAGGESSSSLVILQRFQPDAFFAAEQQDRLQELMAQFHQALADDEQMTPGERQELEQLIETEWVAAIARTATIVSQTTQPKSS